MDHSTPAKTYVIKTSHEDGNLFDTCEKVISENGLGTKRKMLLFFGDNETGKTETFRNLSGVTENLVVDRNVHILHTNIDNASEKDFPLCKIVQYDENENIIHVRVTVKQKPDMYQTEANRQIQSIVSKCIQRYFHLLLFILTVGFRSKLDILPLFVLLFAVYEQYRNHRLPDTVYSMGLVLSLQGIDVLGLADGTDNTMLEVLRFIPCFVIVVILLMFFLGVEKQRGGSLGYTIGLCLIVFPMTRSRHHNVNYEPVRYINALACCLIAFAKTAMRNNKLIKFKSVLTLMQLTTIPLLLVFSQFTYMCYAGLSIIVITDLVSRISYASGIKFSSCNYITGDYLGGYRDKIPNVAVISVFYLNYGYVCILNSKVDTLWNFVTVELFIYLSVGILFAIHIFFFYGTEETRIYEKCNYSTMPTSEFPGRRLALWEFENEIITDALPYDAVCLLVFNSVDAVKNPLDQTKSLHKWLNIIIKQSRTRNVPIFCIGTHSESVSKIDLKKFAITLLSSLDLRFNNMIIKNIDGLPVFYVENEEKNNQGIEILKRKILRETK